MANPLFRNFKPQTKNMPPMQNRQPSKFQQIREIVAFAKGKKNPQELLNIMFQKNPEAAKQFESFLQSGQDPKQFVINFCKQNNIDIQELINNIGL